MFTATERQQGMAVALHGNIDANQFQNGGHNVDTLGEGVDHGAACLLGYRPWNADYKWHLEGLIKVAVLGKRPVITQVFAVIGGENNQGVIIAAGLFQVIKQPPDLRIDL